MRRVLIDGYNLLLRRGGDTGEASRDALARDCSRYRGERLGVEVLVVFDARLPGGGTTETPFPGVTFRYARGDADSTILALVRRSARPSDLMVVTSDRELARKSRELGAQTRDADRFGAPRRRRGPPPIPVEKPLSPAEVEEWLHVFSEAPPGDPEEAAPPRIRRTSRRRRS